MDGDASLFLDGTPPIIAGTSGFSPRIYNCCLGAPLDVRYARISYTTCPWTSVRRKRRRPWKR